MVALLGPNGSGKSTLLNSIAGLLKADAGEIRIDGYCVSKQTTQARLRLGYMVAQERLPGALTPRQCLNLFAQCRELDETPQASLDQAEALGLTPWLDHYLAQCSLGTRQKVAVLLAMLGAPALILLDEPINGLDPVSALALRQELHQLCRTHGCTVLMATHDLGLVERMADHVLVLLDGHLVLNWDEQRLAQEHRRQDTDLEAQIAATLSQQVRNASA
jgi:ABC-2 type transport system ATP-binding protein